MGTYIYICVYIYIHTCLFFDNVDLGCGYPKKRHLAQFPIAEAAAAKLQTRKAHSHAALIGGSSRFIPGFTNVENVNKAICPTIPNFFTSFMGGINGINHQYIITYGWMIAGRWCPVPWKWRPNLAGQERNLENVIEGLEPAWHGFQPWDVWWILDGFSWCLMISMIGWMSFEYFDSLMILDPANHPGLKNCCLAALVDGLKTAGWLHSMKTVCSSPLKPVPEQLQSFKARDQPAEGRHSASEGRIGKAGAGRESAKV